MQYNQQAEVFKQPSRPFFDFLFIVCDFLSLLPSLSSLQFENLPFSPNIVNTVVFFQKRVTTGSEVEVKIIMIPLYCSGNSVVWNTTQSVNSFLWSFHWLINRKSMHMYALSDVTQIESMMPLLGLVTKHYTCNQVKNERVMRTLVSRQLQDIP